MAEFHESGVMVRHAGLWIVIDCQNNWTYGDEHSATIFASEDEARKALTDSDYDEVLADSDEPLEFITASRCTTVTEAQ